MFFFYYFDSQTPTLGMHIDRLAIWLILNLFETQFPFNCAVQQLDQELYVYKTQLRRRRASAKSVLWEQFVQKILISSRGCNLQAEIFKLL